jgi:imidazolonepropionase-like amidohydrolase
MNVSSAALRRAVAGIVLAVPGAAFAQSGTWALTNARIETVTKGVIEKGTIIIRDGLITAVGADAAIPADARVVDLSRRTISPGLIDLTSTLGLPIAAAPADGGRGGGRGGAGTAGGEPRFIGLDPERVVADELHVTPADARTTREAGVTAALIAPGRGALRGLSALVPMRDSASGTDAMRSPVAEHFGFQGSQSGYPQTIMGVIAYQRQSLYDARRHGQLEDRWRVSPRGLARPENDPKLDALIPVVRGTLPAFYEANNENEIRRAVHVGKEFDLKLTIVGATEGFKALDALAGHPVVVSVNFPRPALSTGWAYRQATQHAPGDSAAASRDATRALEGNAAALNKAGIKFALASGGGRISDFVPNVRKAVAAGLPADVALQAMTIRAAELAGLGEALGSIEVGKIANLVVTEGGGVLSDSARVRAVFIDGTRYEITPPPPPAVRAGGAGGTAQVGGTWRLTIESPQGAQAATLNVNQNGTSFSGRISGLPTGDVDVSDGRVNGSSVNWSLVLSFGGQAITLGFNGEVDGGKMSGTVALGPMGSASFTGDKLP